MDVNIGIFKLEIKFRNRNFEKLFKDGIFKKKINE